MIFSTHTTSARSDVSRPSGWSPSEWSEADTRMITVDDEDMLSSTSIQAAGKVLEQWLSDGQHDHDQRSPDQDFDFEDPYVPVTPCDSSASSAEHDDTADDIASLMEVDEQIGENLLGDEVFGGPCGGLEGEYLHLVCSFSAGSIEDSTFSATMSSLSALNVVGDMSEEDRRFLAPLLEDTSTSLMDYDAGFVLTGEEIPNLPSPAPIIDQARYQEIMKKLEASMKRSQETRKSLIMKTCKTEEYNRTSSVTGVLSSIESSTKQLQEYLQNVQQNHRTPV